MRSIYAHTHTHTHTYIHTYLPILFSIFTTDGDTFVVALGAGVLGENNPLNGENILKGALGVSFSEDEVPDGTAFTAVECWEQ